MEKIILVYILFCFQNSYSQKDTLYILIEKPIFGYNCDGDTGTGFIMKSNDKRFSNDYFNFTIQNAKGLKNGGGFDYYTLKELRKVVDISTIKFITISNLIKNKEFWQVHNELSSKFKIFLLEESESRDNEGANHSQEYIYTIIPMIYDGTRKNIIPTDFSKN